MSQEQDQEKAAKRKFFRHRSVSDGVRNLDLASVIEGTTAAQEPMLAPPSPGTPPKKTWERQYRSFLSRNSNRRNQQQPLPPPPAMRSSSAGGTAASRDSNGDNSGSSGKQKADGESSIRGGKYFASMFRSDNKKSRQTHRRRVKSCSDELDGTLRRGLEKAYHSPSSTPEGRIAPLSQSQPPGMYGDTRVSSQSLPTAPPEYIPRVASMPTPAGIPQSPPQSARTVPPGIFDKMQRVRAGQATSMPSALSHALKPQPIQTFEEPNEDSILNKKKAFTEFHNSAQTGRDAVSAFLGDKDTSTSSRSSTTGLLASWTSPPPRLLSTATSYNGLQEVDEKMSMSSVHILKPIVGVENWQTNRRHLIGPAVLSACPVSVQKVLCGIPSITQQNGGKGSDKSNMIVLGNCLLATTQNQFTQQQWSSVMLALRQTNYLFEYDPVGDTSDKDDSKPPKMLLPHGYMHLQHATARPHPHFTDVIELEVYGSPCAKLDKRVLLIRTSERERWISLLNAAAQSSLDSVYEYDKQQMLGSGSYSAVYRGKRRSAGSSKDNEYVHALKVFDKTKFWRHVVKGRERADTIVREASVQSTLTIIGGGLRSFLKISGFFETSEHVVLELELLDGKDLFQCISARSSLKEAEAAQVLKDILTTLECMDRIGLAHRDIKPANVLLCGKHEGKELPAVKVCDFGMATFVGVDGQVRGRCGTPGYVAPEIFSAGMYGGYGNKVDVFSAGVTLYVMLCGYEPFYGETDAELVEANKLAHVEFPNEEWSRVSDLGKDMVQKLMHRDPNERPDAQRALEHPWISKYCTKKEKDTTLEGTNECVIL